VKAAKGGDPANPVAEAADPRRRRPQSAVAVSDDRLGDVERNAIRSIRKKSTGRSLFDPGRVKKHEVPISDWAVSVHISK